MAKRAEGSVRISNQLYAKLRRLPQVVQNVASNETHETARRVRDQARRMVPVDSGDLRDSIVVADTQEALKAGQTALTPNGLTAAVGTILYYAKWVHFGRKGGPPMPATPFLVVPAEAERLAYFRRLRQVVKEGAKAA